MIKKQKICIKIAQLLIIYLGATRCQLTPVDVCCQQDKAKIDILSSQIGQTEKDSDKLVLEIGTIMSRINQENAQLTDINNRLQANQRKVQDIGIQEDKARSQVNSLRTNTAALGAGVATDAIDQNSLLAQLERQIATQGVMFGRWLLKTGPCDNFFIKDTKRGGWFKFAKSCKNQNIYGEPVGEILDVSQKVTTVNAPCCPCSHNCMGTCPVQACPSQVEIQGIIPAQSDISDC